MPTSLLRSAAVAVFFARAANGWLTAQPPGTGSGRQLLARAPRRIDGPRLLAVSEISQQMNDVRAQMETDEKTKLMMQALRCVINPSTTTYKIVSWIASWVS